MSFLNCERLTEDTWQFYCNLCGCELSIEGTAYLEYVNRTRDRPYCWECEGHGLSHTQPEMFKNYWDFTWYLLSPEKETTLVMEFNPNSGLLDGSCVLVERDHWFSLALIRQIKLGYGPACPVVHNSTSVLSNG